MEVSHFQLRAYPVSLSAHLSIKPRKAIDLDWTEGEISSALLTFLLLFFLQSLQR